MHLFYYCADQVFAGNALRKEKNQAVDQNNNENRGRPRHNAPHAVLAGSTAKRRAGHSTCQFQSERRVPGLNAAYMASDRRFRENIPSNPLMSLGRFPCLEEK